MKKILAIALAALMALSMVACTGSGSVDDSIDKYTAEENELITDTGTFTFAEGAADTAVLVSYRGKATHNDKVTVPQTFNSRPVTVIGERAFYQLSSVVEVVLPSTITAVKEYAFAGCVNLSALTWKDETTGAASSGNALPDGVESIGMCAFADCSSLETLGLGKSLKSISDFAFATCAKLTEINIPDTTETIGEGAFWKCSALTAFDSNNVKKIGTLALYECVSMEKITLSDLLEEVGAFAFVTETSTLKDKIDVDSFKNNAYLIEYYENIAEPEVDEDATTEEEVTTEEEATTEEEVTTEGETTEEDTTEEDTEA
jgi:hypothetical protein